MSAIEEIIELCKFLPEDKRAELLDFAYFLLTRQNAETWERRIDQLDHNEAILLPGDSVIAKLRDLCG